jgi:hypothetical protein
MFGLAACGGSSQPAAQHQVSGVVITICGGPTYMVGKHGHSHIEKGPKRSCLTKKDYKLMQHITALHIGGAPPMEFVGVSRSSVRGWIEQLIQRLLHP